MATHEQLETRATESLRPTVVTVEIEPVPVVPAPITLARPATLAPAVPGTAILSWWRETDRLAIASAICGFTAIIPVLSQVAGLVLGIAGLVRIRRARQRGIRLRGKLWALAGIFSSGFALLSWIAVLAMLIAVRMSFAHIAGALPTGHPHGP